MVNHDPQDEGARLRIHEYVLGTLTPEETTTVERHLREGCDHCVSELRLAREIEGRLGMSAEPVPPPSGLKDKLLSAIRNRPSEEQQVWRRWPGTFADKDRILIRRDEGRWETTGIPGIVVRQLAVNEAHDQVSMMIRMDPGTRYPPHRHAGIEECYVLEGDLRHAEQVMRAGDYEVVDDGSIHGWQWTEGGCLLLIHSSRHDQIIG